MKLKNYLALLIAAFYFASCTDEPENITSRVQKIENAYDQVETITDGPKIETKAPRWMIDLAEKQSELDAQNALRDRFRTTAVGDYDYATITNASGSAGCGAGEIITVYMDCEDSGADTQGPQNLPWEITGNKNIRMFFCRHTGTTLNAPVAIYKHAVLKLGPLNPLGTAPSKKLLRYFDNEDSGTSNNDWDGEMGINTQGNNTTLTFLIYAADPVNGYDPFYIPSWDPRPLQFFILSNETVAGTFKYTFYTDDEDDNNQNYWKINGGSHLDGDDSGESLLSGNNNTTFKFVSNR